MVNLCHCCALCHGVSDDDILSSADVDTDVIGNVALILVFEIIALAFTLTGQNVRES
jgi:hypothetical protein